MPGKAMGRWRGWLRGRASARERLAVGALAALLAVGFALQPAVLVVLGARAPGWSHWLCSPGALRATAHAVAASGLGAGALTALEAHWPHLLPLLAGIATVIYLRRADARYRAGLARD